MRETRTTQTTMSSGRDASSRRNEERAVPSRSRQLPSSEVNEAKNEPNSSFDCSLGIASITASRRSPKDPTRKYDLGTRRDVPRSVSHERGGGEYSEMQQAQRADNAGNQTNRQ